MAESNLSEDRNCIAHSSRSKEGRRISRMHSRQAAPNLATANICNLSGIPVCVPLSLSIASLPPARPVLSGFCVAAGCALLPEVH